MYLMLFKYVQFHPWAPSQLSDEASWALALFPACCQPDLSSQCVYHCFFQHHRPGATYQLTSGYSRLFCFLHFLSVSLSLSSLDAPLAPRPVTEGSYFHAGICFWCLMTNPRQPPLLEKKPVPWSNPTDFATHIFPRFSISWIFDPGLAARCSWHSRPDLHCPTLLYHGTSSPTRSMYWPCCPGGPGWTAPAGSSRSLDINQLINHPSITKWVEAPQVASFGFYKANCPFLSHTRPIVVTNASY